MAKAKKYGTLEISDGAWTRTLSKKHKTLPFTLPESINKAYEHLKLILESDDILYVTSYQEVVHDEIFEHVFIMVKIWNGDRRREICENVKNQDFGLFYMNSNHATKYMLHDMKEYGNYGNYENNVICVIEFTF